MKCLAHAAAAVFALLLGLGPRPVPAAEPRPVTITACAPRATDYTFLWWANGWENGAPREPALLCLQAGAWGAVFDPAKAAFVRLGRLATTDAPSYAAADWELPTRADRVLALPECAFELSVEQEGITYRCIRAATERRDWMNFPVRLIESGRFVQRFDVRQMVFASTDGKTLAAGGRLEVVAWPDRLGVILELTPTNDATAVRASLAYDGKILAALPDESGTTPGSGGTGQRLTRTAWTIPLGRREHAEAISSTLPATPRVIPVDSTVPCPVTWEAAAGWYRVQLPSSSWRVAEQPDRLDRFRVSLTNDAPREQVFRLLFDDPSGTPAITGLTPMLRDPAGNPSGIPVQTSKNWHRQEKVRLLYEGPWLHAFTLVRVPARSRTEAEFAITYARWGGVAAASHAQLCLVGWGWNQLWDQAAIGSWGESICYEPDAIQQRCRIDDVRPLMVWGMGANRPQWTWTHNVGGGDFLVYVDAAGRFQPWRAVRTAYVSQGPNLTDVRYSGVTADGAIACRVRVSTPRTDDLNRAYHHLRYDVLRPTRFQRLAFYQVGSDRYHWHQYGRLARGDATGLIEEWEPTRGGKRYSRVGIPAVGEAAWFSLHAAVAADGGKPIQGAWATRGLVVRSWNARLGGRPAAPYASVYGTEAGGIPSANLELSAPPDMMELQPGDFVEADLEFLVLPMAAEDYYGPNAALRRSLADTADTWKAVHRQARDNQPRTTVERGRKVSEFPFTVTPDRAGVAEFTLAGGCGYVPFRVAGVKRPSDFRLTVDDRDGRGPKTVDQSVHGRDFWQSEYDPHGWSWTLTFNLPTDAETDGSDDTRRVRWEERTADR